jgi:peptide/nickel transport system substrate-binding protein
MPGLDPIFYMFRQDSVFQDKNLRKVFDLSINRNSLRQVAKGLNLSKQFLSSSVFGFDPSIEMTKFDIVQAKKLLLKTEFPDGFTTSIITLKENESLANIIKSNLAKVGIQLIIKTVQPQDMITAISDESAESFLIGWQFSNPDGAKFISDFFSKDGQFNFANYSNPKVDELLISSATDIYPKTRLEKLQSALKQISDDVVGVPLFETSKSYLIKTDLEWQPRLDGLIDVENIKIKR